MKTLKNLFLEELSAIYDAEHKILKSLPKMARAATDGPLQSAFLSHLKQTEGHIKMVEKVFQLFEAKAKRRKCEAMAGLLKEGEEVLSNHSGEPTLNAALISAGQKVEHYEIASYGCLREWANLMGNPQASDLLHEILEEEEETDEVLTELARGQSNVEGLLGTKVAGGAEPPSSGIETAEKGVQTVRLQMGG